MPVMLSVPRPSLAARLVGQILSIIMPIMPGNPFGAVDFFSGDLLAGVLVNFYVGDLLDI